jgi:MOSC domain-containing protein YiiM
MDEPQMAALLMSHARPGFYFRVQEEDEVGASDTLCEVSSSPN